MMAKSQSNNKKTRRERTLPQKEQCTGECNEDDDCDMQESTRRQWHDKQQDETKMKMQKNECEMQTRMAKSQVKQQVMQQSHSRSGDWNNRNKTSWLCDTEEEQRTRSKCCGCVTPKKNRECNANWWFCRGQKLIGTTTTCRKAQKDRRPIATLEQTTSQTMQKQ